MEGVESVRLWKSMGGWCLKCGNGSEDHTGGHKVLVLSYLLRQELTWDAGLLDCWGDGPSMEMAGPIRQQLRLTKPISWGGLPPTPVK